MNIAVEGCMHGDLDKVYDTIKYIENTRNIKIYLLLCYGDFQVFCGPDHWANEFGAERLQQESVDDQWVNEFSKLHVDDWAEEFGHQVGEGALGDSSSDSWANSYDEFLSGWTLQGVSMYFLI
ncbi:hypothetical protein ES288_A03G000200v1 [Gossypium darwinii]|uniref:Uncharacterized protein n=1 Tax=Gossypium darwinii TaxID=34276 RepID=A0A5D2GZH1_GOSDA|nr:hypothetical protein ES288_A03G000200v1 [Gossypium darwinii]